MSFLYEKRAEDIREVYAMASNTVKRVKNRKKRNNKFVEERKIFGNRGRRYFRRR